LLSSQVDEVFHDIIVQLDYCISVGYLLFHNHVAEKMRPRKSISKVFFIHEKENTDSIGISTHLHRSKYQEKKKNN
jgi:hypothetical protein